MKREYDVSKKVVIFTPSAQNMFLCKVGQFFVENCWVNHMVVVINDTA